jgi:hypothetical protein
MWACAGLAVVAVEALACAAGGIGDVILTAGVRCAFSTR